MQVGANFASSPARILIDILDPLIVAKEISITDDFKYIKIEDIEKKLRDGKKGIGGVGAKRKEKDKSGIKKIDMNLGKVISIFFYVVIEL